MIQFVQIAQADQTMRHAELMKLSSKQPVGSFDRQQLACVIEVDASVSIDLRVIGLRAS